MGPADALRAGGGRSEIATFRLRRYSEGRLPGLAFGTIPTDGTSSEGAALRARRSSLWRGRKPPAAVGGGPAGGVLGSHEGLSVPVRLFVSKAYNPSRSSGSRPSALSRALQNSAASLWPSRAATASASGSGVAGSGLTAEAKGAATASVESQVLATLASTSSTGALKATGDATWTKAEAEASAASGAFRASFARSPETDEATGERTAGGEAGSPAGGEGARPKLSIAPPSEDVPFMPPATLSPPFRCEVLWSRLSSGALSPKCGEVDPGWAGGVGVLTQT